MRPLDGVKVVELATHIVVPVATRVLADWGAEVVKIEAPSGDKWRMGAALLGLPCSEEENATYGVFNCGKKMMAINLKSEEGKEVLMRLLSEADVFCTNVRMGAIKRLGLDYETLHEKFPRLVYMHITGFGYDGPDAARPGFDMAAYWAMSGMIADFPEKGHRPMLPPSGYGDMITSGNVLSGVLGALYHQAKTGEGLRLTTSLYASSIWCNFAQIIACQPGVETMKLPRAADENLCPLTDFYECSDGKWLLVSADFQHQFKACMTALGLNQYVDDERFVTQKTMQDCGAHKELFHAMEAQFATKTSDEWAKIFTEADIVYQPLIHSGDVVASEQAWANGFLTKVSFPNGHEYVQPNSPVEFFGCERAQTGIAGNIGDDSSAILAQYGYSEDEIKHLMETGAIVGK